MRKVYVVEALRWGDREKHSYVVGVFWNLDEAKEEAHRECDDRGGKYECAVSVHSVGSTRHRIRDVYRTDRTAQEEVGDV